MAQPYTDVREFTTGVGQGNPTADTTAIDMALAAAASGPMILYFPPLSGQNYLYSGAGIDHNPGATTLAPLYLLGAGVNGSTLNFLSVSNPNCIRLRSQATVGSGYSIGGGVSNLTIVGPSDKNLLVIEGLEQWTIESLYTWGGADAVKLVESRGGTLQRVSAKNWSNHGFEVVGNNFSGNTLRDASLIGAAAGHSWAFYWHKTNLEDAGGLTLENIGATSGGGDTSSGGFYFATENATPVNIFVLAKNCAIDGLTAAPAWLLRNVGNVRLVDCWGVTHGFGHHALECDHSAYVTVRGGVFYSQHGSDTSFKNGCDNVRLSEVDLTGPNRGYLTDTTTHTSMRLKNPPCLGAEISNDLSKFRILDAATIAKQTVPVSCPNAVPTPIPFNLNVQDFGVKTANDPEWLIRATGQWRVDAIATHSNSNTAGTVREISARLDNIQITPTIPARAIPNKSNPTPVNLSITFYATAGQKLTLLAGQDSGGSLDIIGAWASLTPVMLL